MQNVPQTRTLYKSHRRAYGAHRTMSPAVKARNVAASIAAREQENQPWRCEDYGLTADSAQAVLVVAQDPAGRVVFELPVPPRRAHVREGFPTRGAY